ncbi:MAG: endonuclease/exonuclease/phosphatase family protein [Candidatus Riflebacteria bacterium]|nr:endonuclease/exonuclease/phosphatase family protein [Candidatus Riflebacteria bacterium]
MKVMTLNMAHGRKDGFHQALLSRQALEANVQAVAALIERENPDLVALQEVDGPSLWSGRFDHAETVARLARYGFVARGTHVHGLGLDYGTAILSKTPLESATSITFEPSFPTLSKGLLKATVEWPGQAHVEVDIVSLHLDFLRKTVRMRQIEAIVGACQPRKRPLVLMGDFNCEWSGAEKTLTVLAGRLGLKTFEPSREGLETYPSLRRRIDWILVSSELAFVRYEVLPDMVSDHRAVVATLRLTSKT